MDPKIKAEWTNLVHDGMQGFGAHFRARLMRMLPKIRREAPELADVLAEAVSQFTPTPQTLLREIAADTGESLKDSDTQLSLVRIEQQPLLSNEPIWPLSVEMALRGVLSEWKEADMLRQSGLAPTRTLLLSGPPGTGKTLAAAWLAREISVPLVTLNLASVMNSFLGKTGQNLARVLDYGRSTACILLLDEFDALAKRRDDAQDVGELKRVVNVLLQAVDEWPTTSLLIAATNHPELLDRAMFRRFDQAVEFPDVSRDQARDALKQLGVDGALRERISRSLVGRPLSDAYRFVRQAQKESVLKKIAFDMALTQIWGRHVARGPKEIEMAEMLALQQRGFSNREIGQKLGIAHTTVTRRLTRQETDRGGKKRKPSPGKGRNTASTS
jgi:Cdc6-like AAA superfamily ATPase